MLKIEQLEETRLLQKTKNTFFFGKASQFGSLWFEWWYFSGLSFITFHQIGLLGSDSAVQVGSVQSPPWSWRIYLTSPHRLIREHSWGLSPDSYFLISLIHSCGFDLINLFVSGVLLSDICDGAAKLLRKSGSSNTSNVRANLQNLYLFWLTVVPLSTVSLTQRWLV